MIAFIAAGNTELASHAGSHTPKEEQLLTVGAVTGVTRACNHSTSTCSLATMSLGAT